MKRIFTILFIYLATVLGVAVLLSGCASSKKTHTSTVVQSDSAVRHDSVAKLDSSYVYHEVKDTMITVPEAEAETVLTDDAMQPVTTASGAVIANVTTIKKGNATLRLTALPNGKIQGNCTCDSLNIRVKKLDSLVQWYNGKERQKNFENTVAKTTSVVTDTEVHRCNRWVWYGGGVLTGIIIMLVLLGVWLFNRYHYK